MQIYYFFFFFFCKKKAVNVALVCLKTCFCNFCITNSVDLAQFFLITLKQKTGLRKVPRYKVVVADGFEPPTLCL